MHARSAALLLALTAVLAAAACGGDAGRAAPEGAAGGTAARDLDGATSTVPATSTTAATTKGDGDGDRNGTTGATGGDAGREAPAYVERVTVRAAAEQRIAVELAGSLPTPCHRPGWRSIPPDADRRIAVEVFSLPPDGDALCAQVLHPFTDVVELGPLAVGSYVVVVNGTEHTVSVA